MRESRVAYLEVLTRRVNGELVVTCLGACTRYWSHMRPRAANFYLADSMGLAIPLALGIALAQPSRRVVVMEGDGGLLMNPGCLATVASAGVRNLIVLLFNNDVYEASGGQGLPPATMDYEGLARSFGFLHALTVERASELEEAFGEALEREGATFICLRTAYDPAEEVPPYIIEPLKVREAFTANLRAGA